MWVQRPSEITELNTGLPLLVAKILAARGIEPGRIEEFVSPSLKSLTHPYALLNMEKACERLWRAFQDAEPVCIYADFDLDGTSGLALLLRGLELLGFDHLDFYQPSRLEEGYGVHVHAIEEIARRGAKVLITVDVGITADEALRLAKERGIDVILTDHHLPKDTLPEAHCIVNPNQPACTAGLGYLSGAGVAYYLFLALKIYFTKKGVPTGQINPKELLDGFVIGTLTDMVPLRGDNRVLCRHGLLQLEQTKRQGLKALMRSLSLQDRALTSADVGLRLAPKLNALSRMDLGVRPIEIFIEQDRDKAQGLVAEMLACNEQRKDLQSQALEQSLNQVAQQMEQGFLAVFAPDFHRGVIGLVATRLVQQFMKPSFVGAMDPAGRIVGSARAPHGVHLLEALGACHEHLVRYGGHAQAAGFELLASHRDHFLKALAEYFSKYPPLEAKPRLYDAEVELAEIHAPAMTWLSSLEPFGQGFEAPILRLSRVTIKSVRELKGGHIKLELGQGSSSQRINAIYFSPPKDKQKLLVLGQAVDVLAEAQWNYFAGCRSLQLILHDVC